MAMARIILITFYSLPTHVVSKLRRSIHKEVLFEALASDSSSSAALHYNDPTRITFDRALASLLKT